MFSLLVTDEEDEPLDVVHFGGQIPSSGTWTARWSAPPHSRLGFYRVRVLSSRTAPVVLPATGTRPENHFTYAVVPDPMGRRDLPSSEAFFGLAGLYPEGMADWNLSRLDLASWLGARWTWGTGLEWGVVRDPWYGAPPEQGDSAWSAAHDADGSHVSAQFHTYRKAPGPPLDYGWARLASGPPGWPRWPLFELPILYLLKNTPGDDDSRHLTDYWDRWFPELFPGGTSGPADPQTYGVADKQGALAGGAAREMWREYAETAAANWRDHDGDMEPPLAPRLYEVTSEPDPNQGFRGVAKTHQGWGAAPGTDGIWRPASPWAEAAARKQALGMLRDIFFLGADGIRAGDPEGLVLGPSFASVHHWDEDDLPQSYYQPPEDPDTHVPLPYEPDGLKGVWYSQKQLLESGEWVNGQWRRVIDMLDAYSVHPYHPDRQEEGVCPEKLMDRDEDDPRPDTIPLRDAIDRVKAGLADLEEEGRGRTLDLYATEFGWPTMGDPARDLAQARAQIRQNLILLGEGFKVGISYQAYDRAPEVENRMGFYYNPEGTTSALADYPTTLNPRPLAPAYAAMTWLLEGHRSLGRLLGLENSDDAASGGAHQYGYVYEAYDGSDQVVAIWDWAGESTALRLPLGVRARHVTFYDWMGNRLWKPDVPLPARYEGGGKWTIDLAPSPLYLVVWGCEVDPSAHAHGPLVQAATRFGRRLSPWRAR